MECEGTTEGRSGRRCCRGEGAVSCSVLTLYSYNNVHTCSGWFTGLTPRLEDESFVLDAGKRKEAGPFVCSIGAGTVHLRLQILIRVGVDL